MWSSLMFTWATFFEEIFVSPLQPRVASRKHASELPATEMFFAIYSRNVSWNTQKLQTAMLLTFALYSSVTAWSVGLFRPTAHRAQKVFGYDSLFRSAYLQQI